jgi:serine/threonine protein kinase
MIAGRFAELTNIGNGAFSRVYRAVDTVSNTPVAIKIDVTGQKTGRNNSPLILYEAAVLRALSHVKGVPQVSWTGEIEDDNKKLVPAIAMQILGSDLENIVEKKGPLTPYSAAVISRSLLQTIKQVHETGYLHRDIKPANIMIGAPGDNSVYICDFGLSKRYLDAAGAHIKNTKKRGVTGTIRYCSPYLHRGEESSRRDDILSIAYVMISLVTAHLPWQSPPKRSREEVGRLKMLIDPKVLCAGCPSQFETVYNSATQLGYYDEPRYDEMCGVLLGLKRDSGR